MENNDLDKHPLLKTEAEFRKNDLTSTNNTYELSYNLILSLRKIDHKSTQITDTNFEGRLCLNFKYYGKSQKDLFLNYNGKVQSVYINGKLCQTNYKNKRIF